MLEVTGLTRRYGELVAVNDVSFAIDRGEIVGLLGHNGAGKTTIMKMLSGYLEPDQGRISIDMHDLASEARLAQRGLGYLPENLPVYPELTVADYLDYAAELKGLAGEAKQAELARVIRATDIGVKLLEPIATLSRGYKQRVGVAQAILGKPSLLILDEPTNGLDPTQTEHMRALLRDIGRDATVILSTHIMQEVDALCDRVLILSGGKLAVDARLEELRQSNHLLLTTSLDAAAVAGVVQPIAGIEHAEALTGDANVEPARQRFRLTLTESSESARLGAAIARAVLGAGGDLYALQPESRDLETLFREVSVAAGSTVAQELNDAA